jgi:pyruvate dehydrogenase E2 component (dihydrolipoamide acetyltransferase)
MAEFRMPSLGADMESGTVVTWLVAVGDRVTRGQAVAEVDTDKAVIEVETFVTGTVEAILVPAGERVLVGTPLAIIAEAAPAEAPAPAGGGRQAEAPRARDTRAPASPLARRKAAELGVDLASLTGTGPGGAVTVGDVEHAVMARSGLPPVEAPTAVEPRPVSPPQLPVAPLTGDERQTALRRAVAAAMARSKREIPHYYLSADVDLSRAVGWLDERNGALPVTRRLLPVALLLKATALALRAVPDLNGFFVEGDYRAVDPVHLGVAVALRGGGLVAPAIHDADRLSVDELMGALRDLVARARSGGLRATEMADPTITVTSLGDQGVDAVLPVIYPPQVAIVGFGRIRERPWAVGGDVAVRPVVTASLAADHRVSDGHRGAQFLAGLDRLLQRPEDL